MSNEEKKIREFLKSIFDTYSKVDDFIFTTYNYEPDFFDEHIVSYLMGFDRKINTIGELQEADEWVRKNHISVYYDRNAMSPGTSCLTVPVFPQNIKTGGVFHPKVIIIYGIQKGKRNPCAHLIVSSCNLTVSGYGRNKEAFACVEINSSQLAKNVCEFINILNVNGEKDRHSDLLSFLSNIKTKNDDVDFLWTSSGKGTKLIDYLENQDSGNLTIVSPYFDETGPEKLLDKLQNKKKTTIIPALDGENYNLHQKDYKELISKKISFQELINEDDSRFIHAKILQLGNKLVVGSYNFTSAALEGKNVEAALVFNNSSNLKLNCKKISESKFLPDEMKVSNCDEAVMVNKLPFVYVIVKWKESKIYIYAEDLEDNIYSLRLDGMYEDLVTDLKEEQSINISAEISNHILKHKTFSIYNEKGKICFKGLINEIDSGEYRPEFSCENLNDSIREWFTFDENATDGKHNLRLINSEDEETEKVLGVTQEKTQDIFDNYYLVARAFENLLHQVEDNKSFSLAKKPVAQRQTTKYLERLEEWKLEKQKADQNLYAYLVTKPGSLENMINFLEKDHTEQKNKDIVYEWLIVMYLQSVITKFPKNLVNYEGSKIYKGKLSYLTGKIDWLHEEISKKIKKCVDKKFIDWVEREFKK